MGLMYYGVLELSYKGLNLIGPKGPQIVFPKGVRKIPRRYGCKHSKYYRFGITLVHFLFDIKERLFFVKTFLLRQTV